MYNSDNSDNSDNSNNSYNSLYYLALTISGIKEGYNRICEEGYIGKREFGLIDKASHGRRQNRCIYA